MIIKLSPVFSDEPAISVHVSGDVVMVNGESFDFSPIPAGYALPLEAIGSQLFHGPAVRDLEGNLTITLLFPHPEYADEASRFPADIRVQNDGDVTLPFTPAPSYQQGILENDGLEPA